MKFRQLMEQFVGVVHGQGDFSKAAKKIAKRYHLKIQVTCEIFWGQSHPIMSFTTTRFGSAGATFPPIEGTAAAFVVDSLNAAGWSYGNDRVSEVFEFIRRELVERFGSDGVPQ